MKKYYPLGFSIVETMVVVAIFSLLLISAIPGLALMLRNNQAAIASARLNASLNLARSEAIKHGIPVTVCPISSSFNPTTAPNETIEEWPCVATTTWNAWKVFKDPNFDASEDFSDGWPIIEYVKNTPEDSITSNIAAPVTFDPMGFASIDPVNTRAGWTWSSSYSSGEWSWGYSYSSSYSGSYYRAFTVDPTGCSGNNARVLELSPNGIITISNAAC